MRSLPLIALAALLAGCGPKPADVPASEWQGKEAGPPPLVDSQGVATVIRDRVRKTFKYDKPAEFYDVRKPKVVGGGRLWQQTVAFRTPNDLGKEVYHAWKVLMKDGNIAPCSAADDFLFQAGDPVSGDREGGVFVCDP